MHLLYICCDITTHVRWCYRTSLLAVLIRLCFAWAELYPLQRKRFEVNNTLVKKGESTIQLVRGEYLTNSILQQPLRLKGILKCCLSFFMCFKKSLKDVMLCCSISMETIKLILFGSKQQSAFQQSIKHLPIQNYEICLKLTIKTSEGLDWDVVLVYFLLTLNRFHICY